jgi:alkanesulfonate monooxygenase SsuD/methylene tetrahydromethanopterin reductase-like flavin-dependent oxidoreductase (luciferase family)
MTANRVSFGLTLPQRGVLFGATTIAELLRLAGEADRSPLFDSTWVGDSLLAKPRPDSIALLGALAATTTRVQLGVGCMASFPVREPVTFACQWATLDLISDGRMLLAACTGIIPQLGQSRHEGAQWGGIADKQRPARLEENILICRRLWSEEHVRFAGTYRTFDDVTIQPRPIQQPPPIWIASNPIPGTKLWERALRRVARLADGWMSVQAMPHFFGWNWQKVCTLLAEEGREARDFPNIAYHNINIGSDRQACLEESKHFLDAYYGPIFPPPVVEAWTAAGTPEQCGADLQGLIRDGAQRVTLRSTSWHQTEQFERLVNEVLPFVSAH